MCMLNIINSPTGEVRMRSGDGVIDSLHLQGMKKGWSAAKGKDADHRSVACERAGQLHGPYADWPGLARPSNFWARPGPMVFQKYRAWWAGPGRRTAQPV